MLAEVSVKIMMSARANTLMRAHRLLVLVAAFVGGQNRIFPTRPRRQIILLHSVNNLLIAESCLVSAVYTRRVCSISYRGARHVGWLAYRDAERRELRLAQHAFEHA